MDEPTAALADHEVELLYAIIDRLNERGVGDPLRLPPAQGDLPALRRDHRAQGRPSRHPPAGGRARRGALVRAMVGRSIESFFPDPAPGTELGEARLCPRRRGNGYVDDVSLELRAGEIVGAGRPAGLRAAPSCSRASSASSRSPGATMALDGTQTHVRSARSAVRQRLALITEDRKAKGLALQPVDPRQRPGRRTRCVPRRHRPLAQGGARCAVVAGGVGPRRSTRRSSSSPAATSRRSCSPAGSRSGPRSC